MKQKRDASASRPIKKSKAAIVLSVISAVLLGLTVVGLYLFRHYLSDPEKIRAAVGDHYFIGALCLILLSAVQVVVALIPGEFLEIAAGYIFGAWWGALLCLSGIVLGSVITILLVRRFGSRFVYAIYPKEKLDALPVLNNPRKRNSLVAILFLIPGTPKDLLTYGIGLTDMKILTYILLTTFARFPSVISSTLGGDAVGKKNIVSAVIIFAVTAVISGIGLLIYNRISKKRQVAATEEKEASEEKGVAEEPEKTEMSEASEEIK